MRATTGLHQLTFFKNDPDFYAVISWAVRAGLRRWELIRGPDYIDLYLNDDRLQEIFKEFGLADQHPELLEYFKIKNFGKN